MAEQSCTWIIIALDRPKPIGATSGASVEENLKKILISGRIVFSCVYVQLITHFLHVQAPVSRSSFMSKRLAAMTIFESGRSGALLPPPPATSQLEPRSLSGPLQEGGSLSPEVPASHGKPTSETAHQQGRCQQESLACVDTNVPSNAQQQPVQQASSTSGQHAARKQAPADQSEEEDDDQFGTFVIAQ